MPVRPGEATGTAAEACVHAPGLGGSQAQCTIAAACEAVRPCSVSLRSIGIHVVLKQCLHGMQRLLCNSVSSMHCRTSDIGCMQLLGRVARLLCSGLLRQEALVPRAYAVEGRHRLPHHQAPASTGAALCYSSLFPHPSCMPEHCLTLPAMALKLPRVQYLTTVGSAPGACQRSTRSECQTTGGQTLATSPSITSQV